MTRTKAGLLALTFACMTVAGMLHGASFGAATGTLGPLWTWASLLMGLAFSGSLLGILAAHEAGHVNAAERHGVSFAGPYFLPGFLALTGTFGAVMRIRQPWPSRRARAEVAASGPIWGFVASVLVFTVGLALSVERPDLTTSHFAEPLIESWLTAGVWRGQPIVWHPVALAGWIGFAVTFVNLLPFGQLDGGHLMTAAFGWIGNLISTAVVLIGVIVLAWDSPMWRFILSGFALALYLRPPDIAPQYAQPFPYRDWTLCAVAGVVLLLSASTLR